MSPQLSAPAPLDGSHRLDGFFCGETALDDWLKRRALANQASRASRTFVVADPEGCVVGYYAMAAGAVSHPGATPLVRRNMPDPVPVMVLARVFVSLMVKTNPVIEPVPVAVQVKVAAAVTQA